MRVIGYLRISTNKQGELSLEAQKRKIIGYCQAYDLSCVKFLYETASGKDIKHRPIFNQAISLMLSGEAEGLIVSKLDRLTRSIKDLEFLLEKYFKKYALISVQDHIDTNTATGRLMLRIQMGISQWEREVIAERTKEAMETKKINKEYTGGYCPFGYYTANGKDLIKNPEEQLTIKEIKGCIDNNFSVSASAKILNSLGYKTKTGKEWNKNNLKRIFKDIKLDRDDKI